MDFPFRLDTPQVFSPKAAFWDALMKKGVEPYLAQREQRYREEVSNAREIAGNLMHGYTTTGNPTYLEHAMKILEGVGKSKPSLIGKNKNLQAVVGAVGPMLQGTGTPDPGIYGTENPNQFSPEAMAKGMIPQGTAPGAQGLDFTKMLGGGALEQASGTLPGAQPASSPTQGAPVNLTPGMPPGQPAPQQAASSQGAPQPQAAPQGAGGPTAPPVNQQVFQSYDTLGGAYSDLFGKRMANADSQCNKSLQWSQLNPSKSNYNDIMKRCQEYKKGISDDNQRVTEAMMSARSQGMTPQEAAKYVGATLSKENFMVTKLMQEHTDRENARRDRTVHAGEVLELERNKLWDKMFLEGEKLGIRKDELKALEKARADRNSTALVGILQRAHDNAATVQQKNRIAALIEREKNIRLGFSNHALLLRNSIDPAKGLDPQSVAQTDAALQANLKQLSDTEDKNYEKEAAGGMGQFKLPGGGSLTINVNGQGQGTVPMAPQGPQGPAQTPKTGAAAATTTPKGGDDTVIGIDERGVERSFPRSQAQQFLDGNPARKLKDIPAPKAAAPTTPQGPPPAGFKNTPAMGVVNQFQTPGKIHPGAASLVRDEVMSALDPQTTAAIGKMPLAARNRRLREIAKDMGYDEQAARVAFPDDTTPLPSVRAPKF